ncbi:MAG TPA: helix-turn-helix domain-containing protein, partial [Ilumatobacteraceae bacterium]|nr:helix-turn-helix domain-containing protein [Ilumatobacteraceae bacterium]
MPRSDPPSTSRAKKASANPRTKSVAAKQPSSKTVTKRTPALKHQGRNSARRNEIVRAAAETFYSKGYDATTTQDIAEAVGMLKGSLYYYI